MDKNMMQMDYPILATKGVALFPHNDINIEAGRVFSKRAIRKANESFNGYILVVPQHNIASDEISLNALSSIATIAKIKSVRNYENGIVKVILNGLQRVKLNTLYMSDGVYYSSFEMVEEKDVDPEQEAAYVRTTAKVLEEYMASNPNVPKSVIERLSKGIAATEFTDVLSSFTASPHAAAAVSNKRR